ncbi:hypothetical protein [Pseudomonas sp. dw_358]|uniref:hypothetical protein n=1 Tax=Pseudomonas sp. dw_358 TaxID=2720083 RepID=UPI002116F3E6|nr:hypothetical protein [Pseudomonas sp. dw_358]
MDIGSLLTLVEQLLPDDRQREQVLWHTPRQLFNFTDGVEGRLSPGQMENVSALSK